MNDTKARAESAYQIRIWCEQMKWYINEHNLWIEPDQIVAAIRAKSISLGNSPGMDTDPSALLGIWNRLPAQPHND